MGAGRGIDLEDQVAFLEGHRAVINILGPARIAIGPEGVLQFVGRKLDRIRAEYVQPLVGVDQQELLIERPQHELDAAILGRVFTEKAATLALDGRATRIGTEVAHGRKPGLVPGLLNLPQQQRGDLAGGKRVLEGCNRWHGLDRRPHGARPLCPCAGEPA